MRNLIFKIGRLAVFAIAILGIVGVAHGQVVKSAISPITYSYTPQEFITLAPSSANVTIPYVAGATTATAPGVTFTTTYARGSTHSAVNILSGFASSGVAFQGAATGTVIGSGSVLTSWNGGAFSPCNGPSGPNPSGPANAACSGLNISSILNAGAGGAGSRTDVFVLQLQNVNTLTPDTYTGIVNVEVTTN